MIEKIVNMFQKPFEVIPGKVAVHNDYQVENETHYKPPLNRNVITQKIINKSDFIAFVNEYKTDQTKIFYGIEQIKAVFNYPLLDKPDYGDSECSMQLVNTREFMEFKTSIDAQMSQKLFIRLLKRLEPHIYEFDGKQVESMDIIEMAESLQATKKVNSVQRNTSQKFSLDVEITAGNTNLTIPRFITFKLPVFKNDVSLETTFTTELFLSEEDGMFEAVLSCYQFDFLVDETIKQLTDDVCAGCDEVHSFMV